MEDPAILSTALGDIYMTPISTYEIIALVLIIICLYFSAFFSGSEVSFFSLLPSHIEELKESNNPRDKKILDLIDDSESLLGTLLIANNFFNIAVITLTEYIMTHLFDFRNAPTAGFVVQVIGTTSVILLVGEIIPKVLCQLNPLAHTRKNITGMYRAWQILTPITQGLVRLGTWISKPFQTTKSELNHEELSRAIELTTANTEEQGVLNEIILFHKKSVAEVMQPRMEIKALDLEQNFGYVRTFIIENGYSRIPVYEERIDNIKGLLYAKDLLPHLKEGDDYNWQKLLREAMFVPESMMVSHLLEDFRSQKVHMAIVVDEFGGTCGLVTMEDLLEEIVGEINDEYDDDEQLYTENPDGTYTLDGKISILDFLRVVKVANYDEIIKETDEAETLGGLLLEIKQDFPTVGEVINIEGHAFKILEMGRRRISKVLFVPYGAKANPTAQQPRT